MAILQDRALPRGLLDHHRCDPQSGQQIPGLLIHSEYGVLGPHGPRRRLRALAAELLDGSRSFRGLWRGFSPLFRPVAFPSGLMNPVQIWSIRFSGDGREIVAGTQGEAVYVYDLERRQTVVKIDAHDNDVNAVCYGDQSSPHILYSGSDDTTLKVWDRRSLADGREAGVFLGHNEGLTYVDSKGDGRYVLSNGKDQTMKLWDLRRMIDRHRFDEVRPTLETSTDDFDYRRMRYDPADYRPHPHDSSVVTFHGHSVHKTLIRCHFSPPGSTDSRYVYTGSEDGAVYIYNLDATLAGKVDVRRATEASRRRAPRRAHRPRVAYHMFGGGGGRDPGSTCVRDASWHPHAPVIAATSWIGDDMDSGACTLHTWSDGADASEDDDDDDDDDSGLATLVDEHLQRRTCWA